MNKSIKCIPFPDIEGAYVVISAFRMNTLEYPNKVKKNMSFLYDNGDIGAEWEPEYGPITVLYKCDKDHKDAEPHWFYDYYTGQGNWSQLAVIEEGLPEAFISGDYKKIFEILKLWSNR